MKSRPWCDMSGVWLLSSAELWGILDRSVPYQTTVRSQRQWNFAPDSSHTSSGRVQRDGSFGSTLTSFDLELQRFPVDFSFLRWNPSATTFLTGWDAWPFEDLKMNILVTMVQPKACCTGCVHQLREKKKWWFGSLRENSRGIVVNRLTKPRTHPNSYCR